MKKKLNQTERVDNMSLIDEIISNNMFQTNQTSSRLSTNPIDVYNRISFDMNIYDINNKVINLGAVYGIGDYYVIAFNVNNDIAIIDLNLKNKYFIAYPEIFDKYLNTLGISENKLSINDIFYSFSISR